MLLCLDNAIAAGDELTEEEILLEREGQMVLLEPGEEAGGGVGTGTGGGTVASSSHSSGKDDHQIPLTGSPLFSATAKARSVRNSAGRHRPTTETFVSSSDMDASDTWEKESGAGTGETPVKVKKDKDKDKVKSPKT